MNSNDGSRPVSSPLGPKHVSLATGVRSDGHVLGRSLAFRDYEESIALKHASAPAWSVKGGWIGSEGSGERTRSQIETTRLSGIVRTR